MYFNHLYLKKRISYKNESILSFVYAFCRALDKNEYNHITATYFLLAERRLKIARQEQTQSVSATNNGKNSPKKLGGSGGDVIDGVSEIAACNLLAPPSNYYNSSRIDGLTTTVSENLIINKNST